MFFEILISHRLDRLGVGYIVCSECRIDSIVLLARLADHNIIYDTDMPRKELEYQRRHLLQDFAPIVSVAGPHRQPRRLVQDVAPVGCVAVSS